MPRYCGQLKDLTMESDGPFFRVTFKSNDRFDGTGFFALYQFTPVADAIMTTRHRASTAARQSPGDFLNQSLNGALVQSFRSGRQASELELEPKQSSWLQRYFDCCHTPLSSFETSMKLISRLFVDRFCIDCRSCVDAVAHIEPMTKMKEKWWFVIEWHPLVFCSLFSVMRVICSIKGFEIIFTTWNQSDVTTPFRFLNFSVYTLLSGWYINLKLLKLSLCIFKIR